MGTQSRELVPHISVYYEITLVRIRIMGGSKIHAHMAQLFIVIHTKSPQNTNYDRYFFGNDRVDVKAELEKVEKVILDNEAAD